MESKNKITVIYRSKYGSSKKYAGWIAIKLDADLYELSDITSGDLLDYEKIIFVSSIYSGKILGVNFLTKNFDKIKDKDVIICTVGILSDSIENKRKIIETNFDEEFAKTVKLYNLKGAYDYKNLTLLDKVMMNGLKIGLQNKSVYDYTGDDEFIFNNVYSKLDFTDKELVTPVVEYILEDTYE